MQQWTVQIRRFVTDKEKHSCANMENRIENVCADFRSIEYTYIHRIECNYRHVVACANAFVTLLE